MQSPPFGLFIEEESLSDDEAQMCKEDPCQFTTPSEILQWTGGIGAGFSIIAAAPVLIVSFIGIWSIGVAVHFIQNT